MKTCSLQTENQASTLKIYVLAVTADVFGNVLNQLHYVPLNGS